MTLPKTLYMGTSEFAVPTLRALGDAGYPVVGVVTQPDRPAGRGLELRASPVKEEALRRGWTVLQPQRLRDPGVTASLAALAPDLIVVASYGQILPKEVLDLPSLACLNVHASLLPRYRGAAPIHRAILEGETETGVSIMHMSPGLDEGDVVLARSTPIGPDEDAGSLHDRLALLGASALLEAVALLREGRASRTPQDPAKATYAPSLKREHCRLDWTRPARRLHDQVRGLHPWPVAETTCAGQPLKVLESRISGGRGDPGTVLTVSGNGVEVAAGEGSLILVRVQPPGRKRMSARDYAIGHPQAVTGRAFA